MIQAPPTRRLSPTKKNMLIKVSFRGQVRRFEAKFPRNKNQETEEEYLNFQWLADKLSQLFQNEETLQEKVSILYLDEQGK